MPIDQLQINFSESSLLIMNIVIAFIMFGGLLAEIAFIIACPSFTLKLFHPISINLGESPRYK